MIRNDRRICTYAVEVLLPETLGNNMMMTSSRNQYLLPTFPSHSVSQTPRSMWCSSSCEPPNDYSLMLFFSFFFLDLSAPISSQSRSRYSSDISAKPPSKCLKEAGIKSTAAIKEPLWPSNSLQRTGTPGCQEKTRLSLHQMRWLGNINCRLQVLPAGCLG